MKFYNSKPVKEKEFQEEAPMYHMAARFKTSLMFVSGGTAFLGLAMYFWGPISQSIGIALGVVAFGLIAYLFVIPAEIGIAESGGYIARSVLTKKYKKADGIFSMVIVGLLLAGLLGYSFSFSLRATKDSVYLAGKEEKPFDPTTYDEALTTTLRQNAQTHRANRNDVEGRYRDLIQAERDRWEPKIAQAQRKVRHYQEQEEKTGRSYASMILKWQSEANKYRDQQAESVAAIEARKADELAGVDQAKQQADRTAHEQRDEAVDEAKAMYQAGNANNDRFASILAFILSRFAAFSVVLVVLIQVYIEIVDYRTERPRKVFFENADIQGSGFARLLSFPAVALSRWSGWLVRWLESILPDEAPPNTPGVIYDPNTLSQGVANYMNAPSIVPTKWNGQWATGTAQAPARSGGQAKANPIGFKTAGSQTPPTQTAKPKKVSTMQTPQTAPDDLDSLLVAAFKGGYLSKDVYDVAKIHPSDFKTVSEYMRALKKRARNVHSAANDPNRQQETRAYNQVRFEAMRKELTRMYVRVIDKPGHSLDLKQWLTPEERNKLV
jgi:hypothetical protein